MTTYIAFATCECADFRLLEPLDAFREFGRGYIHHPRVLHLRAQLLQVDAVQVCDFSEQMNITVESSPYTLHGKL